MYVSASSIINIRTYIFIEFITANIYAGKQEICMLLLILIDVSDNKGKSVIVYLIQCWMMSVLQYTVYIFVFQAIYFNKI